MRLNLTPVHLASARCRDIAARFDLDIGPAESIQIECPLPGECDQNPSWTIGLILGPNGSGKSAMLKAGFGESSLQGVLPLGGSAVVDSFPEDMRVSDIAFWLSSVGLSSPSVWIQPGKQLAAGQAWRAGLAIAAARAQQGGHALVIDDFAAPLDLVQGRIGSFGFAKALRKTGVKMVAATTREDLVDWLQPDWVMKPQVGCLQWRSLWPKPTIRAIFQRSCQSLWGRFSEHHYLKGKLHRSSVCFALIHDEWGPIAFSAWLPFFGARVASRREHRTVCLPAFQGVGAGRKLSGLCASLFRGLGYRALSTTSHPGVIASRLADPDWKLLRRLSFCSRGQDKSLRVRHATHRATAGFEYIGPAMSPEQARSILGSMRRPRNGRVEGLTGGRP